MTSTKPKDKAAFHRDDTYVVQMARSVAAYIKDHKELLKPKLKMWLKPSLCRLYTKQSKYTVYIDSHMAIVREESPGFRAQAKDIAEIDLSDPQFVDKIIFWLGKNRHEPKVKEPNG